MESVYEKGRACLDKHDNDGAIAAFTEVIRLDPQSVDAYCNRGCAYGQKGDWDKAIADYTEAIRLGPKNALATFGRGTAYLYKAEHDKAIIDLTEAIRVKPDYAEAYYNRGAAYNAKGQQDKAIADYTEAIRLNPKDAPTYSSRGAAYCARGEYGKAIADYKQAIDLSPNLEAAPLYVARGEIYASQRDWYKAIADYSKAIKLNPKDAKGYNDAAWLWATCPEDSLRDGNQAVECARQACELTGWKEPNCLDTLAAAYAEVGDYVSAEKWQQEAVTRIKEVAESQRAGLGERLELYRQKKPYRMSANLNLNAAVALAPGDVVVTIEDKVDIGSEGASNIVSKGTRFKVFEIRGNWVGVRAIVDGKSNTGWVLPSQVAKTAASDRLTRGMAYLAKDEYDKAIPDLDEAIRLDEDLVEAYVARGTVYYRKGECDKAILDLNKAINLDPNSAAAQNALGNAHFAQGKNDMAIADYAEAIRLVPNIAIYHVNRGNTYCRRGNYELGIQDYDKAIQLAPSDAVAYSSAAWILAACPEQGIRNGTRAVEYAQKACELTGWRVPDCLDTLATSYAETGDFDSARKWEQEAIHQAKDAAEVSRAGYSARLELYRQKREYRIPGQ